MKEVSDVDNTDFSCTNITGEVSLKAYLIIKKFTILYL